MNPIPSKPPTISFLILVLFHLLSVQPMISANSAPAPRHHHPSKHSVHSCSGAALRNEGWCFRSWCKKALHSKLCASIVKKDPRECWKASPEGISLILIKAAKANKRKTVSFIKNHLKNATNVEVREGLANCLFGYRTVGKALDISMCELSDPDARSEFLMALRQVDDEVTYDCEWYQPQPFPRILKKMFKRVNRFSAILQTAEDIINLI